jgi:hypothetical protein
MTDPSFSSMPNERLSGLQSTRNRVPVTSTVTGPASKRHFPGPVPVSDRDVGRALLDKHARAVRFQRQHAQLSAALEDDRAALRKPQRGRHHGVGLDQIARVSGDRSGTRVRIDLERDRQAHPHEHRRRDRTRTDETERETPHAKETNPCAERATG